VLQSPALSIIHKHNLHSKLHYPSRGDYLKPLPLFTSTFHFLLPPNQPKTSPKSAQNQLKHTYTHTNMHTHIPPIIIIITYIPSSPSSSHHHIPTTIPSSHTHHHHHTHPIQAYQIKQLFIHSLLLLLTSQLRLIKARRATRYDTKLILNLKRPTPIKKKTFSLFNTNLSINQSINQHHPQSRFIPFHPFPS
jgi:hypothetical protein